MGTRPIRKIFVITLGVAIAAGGLVGGCRTDSAEGSKGTTTKVDTGPERNGAGSTGEASEVERLPQGEASGYIYYLEKTGEPHKFEFKEYDVLNEGHRTVARLRHTPGEVKMSNDGKYLFYNVGFSVKPTGFCIMYRPNRDSVFSEIRYIETPDWAIDGPGLLFDETEGILYLWYEYGDADGKRFCFCRGGQRFKPFYLDIRERDFPLTEAGYVPFIPVKFTGDYVYFEVRFNGSGWLIKCPRPLKLRLEISNAVRISWAPDCYILDDDSGLLFDTTEWTKDGYRSYLSAIRLDRLVVISDKDKRIKEITSIGSLTPVQSPDGRFVIIEPSPYWASSNNSVHPVYLFDLNNGTIQELFDYKRESVGMHDEARCIAWID